MNARVNRAFTPVFDRLYPGMTGQTKTLGIRPGMANCQRLDYHFAAWWDRRFAVSSRSTTDCGRWIGGVVALAALLAGAVAQAQPAPVEAIANLAGTDRQRMLEAGARREGALLLYTTGTQIKPLLDRFAEKYPYLKVELVRAGPTDVARRVLEEYRAGFEKVDAFELSSNGLILPRDENVLQAFQSPELAAFAPEAVEPKRHWVVVRESFIGVGVNTKLVAADKAPRTYQDLLDAQWRGRMALSGSSTTPINWVGAMVILHGAEFVRKLGLQNIRIYNITGRALANLMLSGEVALSPTIYNSHVIESSKRGAPLAWHAPGPVSVTDAVVAIARKAPHPHAAMLFIDFAMSKEGALIYEDIGYYSPRRDMAAGASLQKLYLTNRPNYLREYDDWARLYQDVFVRRRP
jgi:iron(III) transport system substrate-binding protein